MPFDWLYISANASVIWGKRFELGYMAPLLFTTTYQNVIGNFENVGQEINVKLTFPPIGSFYASFFADEMEFTNPAAFVKRPRNMVAFLAGYKNSVPFLPLTKFTFQYTKIEPFVYAHYPEDDYPFYTNPVDMSYTHDDENLGYHLPPNSEEFLVKLESFPHPNITATLQYQLIRHGTNDPDTAGDFAIYGDVDLYMDYTLGLANYPDKNFLQDGIYDWNNIVTLEGSYTFSDFPLTITAEYCFAHTFWDANNTGLPEPPAQIRNIVALKATLWR